MRQREKHQVAEDLYREPRHRKDVAWWILGVEHFRGLGIQLVEIVLVDRQEAAQDKERQTPFALTLGLVQGGGETGGADGQDHELGVVVHHDARPPARLHEGEQLARCGVSGKLMSV